MGSSSKIKKQENDLEGISRRLEKDKGKQRLKERALSGIFFSFSLLNENQLCLADTSSSSEKGNTD